MNPSVPDAGKIMLDLQMGNRYTWNIGTVYRWFDPIVIGDWGDFMGEYDDRVLDVFLENQLKLVPEVVAETREEAESFLEDCMATVFDSVDEVRAYFEEIADVSGISDEELLEESEVFVVGDGRFLVVEG